MRPGLARRRAGAHAASGGETVSATWKPIIRPAADRSGRVWSPSSTVPDVDG